MPVTQELVALGIVAIIAGVFAWRRLGPGARRRQGAGAACDGCGPATARSGEATVHFYRRRNDEGPARGPSNKEPGRAARDGSGADALEREATNPEADQ